MITHLNAVPESVLREARALADPTRIMELLVARTSPESWGFLEPFMEEVVLGGAEVASWRRGQVVVPDFSLADQLRLEPVQLLAPLGGDFSHRVVPAPDDWRSGASWVGAPALLLPDADYRYTPPELSIGLGTMATEPVGDRAVALRRWTAARLARAARAGAAYDSPESLIAAGAGLPPLREWSRDAAIAADGLLRERREMGADVGGIPGMRGPDDWFRGE